MRADRVGQLAAQRPRMPNMCRSRTSDDASSKTSEKPREHDDSMRVWRTCWTTVTIVPSPESLARARQPPFISDWGSIPVDAPC